MSLGRRCSHFDEYTFGCIPLTNASHLLYSPRLPHLRTILYCLWALRRRNSSDGVIWRLAWTQPLLALICSSNKYQIKTSAETWANGTEVSQMKNRDIDVKDCEGNSVVSLLLSRCIQAVEIAFVVINEGRE